MAICGTILLHFLAPFWSTKEFKTYCHEFGYDKNVAKIRCENLQGHLALALIVLTIEICLGVYMLVLGYRLAQKQYIEYARMKKERLRAQASPSGDGLVFSSA
jgi:hypothetical protein